MEFGAEYTFTNPAQFFAELDDLIAVNPNSSLEDLDYALRNYIGFTSTYLDEYLSAPGALDQALFALLTSPLFTSHIDRMTTTIISVISPLSPPSTLFISIMLLLHLGQPNPLQSTSTLIHSQSSNTSSKVFKFLRKAWKDVVPVLVKCVEDAGVVSDSSIRKVEEEGGKGLVESPNEGWGERLGAVATAVLYEVCRVQKLNEDELAFFNEPFIERLFSLVERTRDALDETFNYTLIKLIIALNEQFMVVALPQPQPHTPHSHSLTHGGNGELPPPILPTKKGKGKEKDGDKGGSGNLVLEVLKRKEADSKTFGENIIFILNRSNGTPDSLCVSLLILKILYLLFTTSGTHEYFYTNDLCVLVDVFIRELCDLGDESEGLRHTYLRVLHPLLTNTQLRHHPYKRPLLRRVLTSIISNSHYCEVDPTTRRLVERNLKGSWCDGLVDEGFLGGEQKRKGSGGWSSGMGRSWSSSNNNGEGKGSPKFGGHARLGQLGNEMNGSTLSVDIVAVAKMEEGGGRVRSLSGSSAGGGLGVGHRKTGSNGSGVGGGGVPPQIAIVLPESTSTTPPGTSLSLSPVSEIAPPLPPAPPVPTSLLPPPRPNRQRSTSLLSPRPRPIDSASSLLLDEEDKGTESDSPSSSSRRYPSSHLLGSEEIVRSVSTGAGDQPGSGGRRRRPPPPPKDLGGLSRPRTPAGGGSRRGTPEAGVGEGEKVEKEKEKRRQAPEPPKFRRADLVEKVEGLRVSSY